jgi:ACT domain-containing protein
METFDFLPDGIEIVRQAVEPVSVEPVSAIPSREPTEVIVLPPSKNPGTNYNSTTSNGANLPTDIQSKLQNAIEKQNTGRASTFTEEKALTLLETIAGGSTIKEACDKIGISRATFYIWRSVVPGFFDMTKQAQELQADSMVDDSVKALESVDVESKDADPRKVMAMLRKVEQIARFKFDLAKCHNFKVYGDKKAQLNVNANVDVTDVDVSKWFNG